MAKIDLDALIPREEFSISGDSKQGQTFDKLSVKDLIEGSFIYPLLKKPIFQRETNEWDEIKIGDFIESLLNGDLIPSIILWRSQTGLLFVIDGAHRLSALLSWLKDDYGDGPTSLHFYSNFISEEQKEKAIKVRNYINKRIGPFDNILKTANDDKNVYYNKAAGLINSLIVQWVMGDAKVAENSFFRINQQGVALNSTETKLLQSRKKGNCIAARAISKAASGYKYWSDFSAENQTNIENIAKEINTVLFKPPFKTPVKSIDYLPIAGKSEPSQALPLILDFINITNNIPHNFNELNKKKIITAKDFFLLDDDISGEHCLQYLRETRKIAWRISSMHMSSLGLHPIVYFYTLDGRHKPASFYAIASWIMEMTKKSDFNDFLNVRPKFEDLLLKYDYLTQDINRRHRQVINSYTYIRDFYIKCIELLNNGKDIDDTIASLITDDKFSYLKIEKGNDNQITSEDFTDNRKSKVIITKSLPHAQKCEICGGLIDPKSITIDHIEDKKDGGLGSIDNAQIAHPYCNSAYKDYLRNK